jgi:hypothetical protein
MAKLYLDEDCSDKRLKKALIKLGYDVQTTLEADNIGKDDKTQLIYAVSQNRAIVTHNRKDFIRIHKETPNHSGIIVCTQNPNNQQLAEKINAKINKKYRATNKFAIAS